MVRPAGCGIFGKGCGTGVSLIARLDDCGGECVLYTAQPHQLLILTAKL